MIAGGATVGLNGQSVYLDGALTLTNGTITNGTLSASSFALQNGEADANLVGGPMTFSGDGYVALKRFSASTSSGAPSQGQGLSPLDLSTIMWRPEGGDHHR